MSECSARCCIRKHLEPAEHCRTRVYEPDSVLLSKHCKRKECRRPGNFQTRHLSSTSHADSIDCPCPCSKVLDFVVTDGVRYDNGPDGAFYHAMVTHVREADKQGNIITYRQELDGSLTQTGVIEKVDPQVTSTLHFLASGLKPFSHALGTVAQALPCFDVLLDVLKAD